MIIPEHKCVRRTAVAIGGDAAGSLLNIFMVWRAAEIKSMGHKKLERYRTQNPNIRRE